MQTHSGAMCALLRSKMSLKHSETWINHQLVLDVVVLLCYLSNLRQTLIAGYVLCWCNLVSIFTSQKNFIYISVSSVKNFVCLCLLSVFLIICHVVMIFHSPPQTNRKTSRLSRNSFSIDKKLIKISHCRTISGGMSDGCGNNTLCVYQ